MRITSPGKSIWKDTVGLFERFDSVSPGPEDILFETGGLGASGDSCQ
jgi:hypothetical protein